MVLAANRYQGSGVRQRLPAALLSAAIVALLGWLLVTGLGVLMPAVPNDPLKLFSVMPPAPPPPEADIVRRHRTPRPEGAAAPPNLKAKPTEVVAPEPIVPVTAPPPVVVATVAGPGIAAVAGAAPIRGPGTGAGGIGTGRGSGGRGNGDGGGGGRETGPRLIRDDHRGIRFPQSAPPGRYQLTIRYAVEPDGRVDDCRILISSGNVEIDGMTCSNAERRLRYKPCRDGDGRAVLCWIVRDEEWTIKHDRTDRNMR